MSYAEFLEGKLPDVHAVGIDPGPAHERLFPFQVAMTQWAIRKGRAALWADCGLGKTIMQIEWARQVGAGGKTLILAPLGVQDQTIAEGKLIGVDVMRCVEPIDAPIQITNYQRLQHFVGADYRAIVLDESSILKSIDGKTRTMLLKEFTHIPYRLCCTATPAPNDIAELANHAEFLGAMSRVEMLATFFVHDASGDGWRLKGHARDDFWKWVARWGLFVRKPSDVGFSDDGFDLPALNVSDEVVEVDYTPEGMLFAVKGVGIDKTARKATIESRVERLAEIINATDGQCLVWCGLNDEGRQLEKALNGDAANIEGSTPDDSKEAMERSWRAGQIKTLITKSSIFGFGLNWQHCHNVFFLGIDHSYEQYYQSIRRCWRFGQKSDVSVKIVTSTAEAGIAANVRRKELEAARFAEGIVSNMRDAMKDEVANRKTEKFYETDTATGDGWTMHLGDAIERIREVETGSIGLSVFSPPFAALYTYSASERDMGNSKDYDQFFEHFGYLVPELVRVTMPGRRACVHVQQVTTTKTTHGVIGWRDFRADVCKLFVESGFIYDGEVVIDKDPQAQAIRTKSKALMFVQKNKDSSWSRPAMADYILLFRAPGDNEEAIKPEVTNEEWIMWARPIWYNIRETETLQAREATSEKDERHICPLQLGTIERCVRLWSNPGDTVFSPFAGIGSEGYESVRRGRKFVGIELKPEYWKVACKNMENANVQLSLL